MTSRVLQSLVEESFFLADNTASFLGFFSLAGLFILAGFGFCEGKISGCNSIDQRHALILLTGFMALAGFVCFTCLGVELGVLSVSGSGSRSEPIGHCFFSGCRSSGGLRLVIIILR